MFDFLFGWVVDLLVPARVQLGCAFVLFAVVAVILAAVHFGWI